MDFTSKNPTHTFKSMRDEDGCIIVHADKWLYKRNRDILREEGADLDSMGYWWTTENIETKYLDSKIYDKSGYVSKVLIDHEFPCWWKKKTIYYIETRQVKLFKVEPKVYKSNNYLITYGGS